MLKRKLASLLVNEESCSSWNKEGWNAYKRTSYRLDKFRKKHPEKFYTITNKLISDLTELEKACNSCES